MVNPQIENGHLDIANEIVEVLAQSDLSGGEFRVLLAIFRKTWAWHKKEDWISLSQLARATKMSIRTICRIKKLLLTKRTVVKTKRGLKFNKYYNEWLLTNRPLANRPLVKMTEPVTEMTDTKETNTKETNIREYSNKARTDKNQSEQPLTPKDKYFQSVKSFFDNPPQDWYAEISKAYPSINLEQALHFCKAWILSNYPAKQKKNFARFVVNWLNREVDYGRTTTNRGDSTPTPQQAEVQKRLAEWRGKNRSGV